MGCWKNDDEFQDTMKKFDAINENNMFSYRADKARNAFEKWLFCDGSDNEKIAFWNMFRESVNS